MTPTGTSYTVTVTGGGRPLTGVKVLLYMRRKNGKFCKVSCKTRSGGIAKQRVPMEVAFIRAIPYDGHWETVVRAPKSGGTIVCPPLPEAAASGSAWWHRVMGVDGRATERGAGIRVGVIDTGCGPHPNLAHVRGVGVFVGGRKLPGRATRDVDPEAHGTHTTGIIGAQPKKRGDYAGMAPGCALFHARVCRNRQERMSPYSIAKAIKVLSRDYQCDLINISLGDPRPKKRVERAIRDAFARGTLCICAAGNDGRRAILYPAAYRDCIAVSSIGRIGWAPIGTFSASCRPTKAALNGRDELFLSAISNFGAGINCMGPGVGIVSTVRDRGAATGLYMEMGGTSEASPAVCGALAVILSKNAKYKALPRDRARAEAARKLLFKQCRRLGLAAEYVGRGLPQV